LIANVPRSENRTTALDARDIAERALRHAGWITAPTSDNAPSVDLLAFHKGLGLAIAVEVKGTARPDPAKWFVGSGRTQKRFPQTTAFYWAFVDNLARKVYWVPSTVRGLPNEFHRANGSWYYGVELKDIQRYDTVPGTQPR
jgi:hypothetical protein